MFKESQPDMGKTPAAGPHEDTQVGNGDAFSNPEYTAGSLQDVLEQVGETSGHTKLQGEDPQAGTGRIPSPQLQQNVDRNKTNNIIHSNITEKEPQSPTLHSDLPRRKESPATHEVLPKETALQSSRHGAAMTKQQHLPAVTSHDVHEVLESHKDTTNERENSEQSVSMTERDHSEQKPSSFFGVNHAHHEMEETSHSKYSNGISPYPLMVDNENMPLEGSHSLEDKGKIPKNGIRNSPETVICHEHCSVTATAKQFLRNDDDKSYTNAIESLDENGFLIQSDSAQNAPYKIKTSSVNNKLSGCKQDNTSFDDPVSSKSYTFHPQARRQRNLRRRSESADEQSTLLHNGRTDEVTVSWKTFVTKYHPIELYLITDRQISPIYSSVLLEKGIVLSIFFWVYLIAFLYAACYIVSFFTTPFSIFGVIMKVLLIHNFPSIIQLEVFRVVDYVMTFIFDTFT